MDIFMIVVLWRAKREKINRCKNTITKDFHTSVKCQTWKKYANNIQKVNNTYLLKTKMVLEVKKKNTTIEWKKSANMSLKINPSH